MVWVVEQVSGEREAQGCRRGYDPEVIYSDIAPYIAHHEKMRMVIEDAVMEEDPFSYIEVLMAKSQGLLKVDLKIVYNRFSRTKG